MQWLASKAHNLEVGSSNLSLAIVLIFGIEQGLSRKSRVFSFKWLEHRPGQLSLEVLGSSPS